jgi:hypothetical protein
MRFQYFKSSASSPNRIGRRRFYTFICFTAGTGYVTHFLKNWRTPTENIGKQLLIVYAWYAYQSGVSYPVLEHPGRKLDYISGRVIQGIRKYLAEIDGKIVLHNKYIRTKLRVNDRSIMERVTKLEFTQNQRERINCVRMYLGVMYLSEICNMSGSELQAGIENDTHDKDVYNVTMQKPKQNKPNSYSWKFLTRTIQSFTTDGKKLKSTLGPWTGNHSRSS